MKRKPKKIRSEFDVGDHVTWAIDGNYPGEGLVIGEMDYSAGHVICVASQNGQGMPISDLWCQKTGTTDIGRADEWRRTYIERYGQRFLPSSRVS
jgi:hypothetical protein